MMELSKKNLAIEIMALANNDKKGDYWNGYNKAVTHIAGVTRCTDANLGLGDLLTVIEDRIAKYLYSDYPKIGTGTVKFERGFYKGLIESQRLIYELYDDLEEETD